MTQIIYIRGLSRTAFRVGLQRCSSQATITVDLDNSRVRRDLAAYKGLWTVIGGGAAAGSNGQIQFNDNGTFNASPDFIWEGNQLKLITIPNGDLVITGNAPGVQVHISATNGDAIFTTGGEVDIRSGDGGLNGDGGDFQIAAGLAGNGGDGGNLSLSSGSGGINGDSGEISIRAGGSGLSGGQGGQVVINGGNGTAGGGNVIIQAGAGTSDGTIQFYSGSIGMTIASTGVELISSTADATDYTLLLAPTGDGGDVDAILKIVGPTNFHGGLGEGYFINIVDADGTSVFNFDPSGALQICPNTTEGVAGTATLAITNPSGLDGTVLQSGGKGQDRINVGEAGHPIFRVGPLGEIVTMASQPVDNSLLSGSVALWFDSTNGAAKVMFKGKSANGTVVTGALALA